MKKYSHLLSPVWIGNVILKNRMISTNSMPHYLMGPEQRPAMNPMEREQDPSTAGQLWSPLCRCIFTKEKVRELRLPDSLHISLRFSQWRSGDTARSRCRTGRRLPD